MHTEAFEDPLIVQADHFSNLLNGVDPVVALSHGTLTQAVSVLRAAVDQGYTEYGEALSVAESAHCKTL